MIEKLCVGGGIVDLFAELIPIIKEIMNGR